MFEHMSEEQAKAEILKLVKEYNERYHRKKDEFKEGSRIAYA